MARSIVPMLLPAETRERSSAFLRLAIVDRPVGKGIVGHLWEANVEGGRIGRRLRCSPQSFHNLWDKRHWEGSSQLVVLYQGGLAITETRDRHRDVLLVVRISQDVGTQAVLAAGGEVHPTTPFP